MSNYFIHIDSSTKNKKGTNVSYGISTVAWTIRCNGDKINRAGLLYSTANGPNKIIYEGILAAISTLEPEHFCNLGTDKVFVFIDSQIVLDQINGTKKADKMISHLFLVNNFSKKFKNVTFDFSYKNEKSPEFKEVDTLSKKGREWLPKIIKSL